MRPNVHHHTLSVLVENKAGVLARVANLFSRRGYNIYSLAVAPTEDDRFSRITVVVDVESAPLEQIVKQLYKLINVVRIVVVEAASSVERELLLARVDTGHASTSTRSQVLELAQVFEARILAVSHEQLTLSLDGHPGKIDDFEELLRSFGIVELQRTGRVALPKFEREAPRLRDVRGKVS